jgi:hypothetical protein
MKTGKKTNTFVLKNINVGEIDKKYGFEPKTQIGDICDRIPESTTITDLYSTKTNCLHPFLEKNKKYYISMVDIRRKTYTDTCCFWCRHIFSGQWIGCPIRYECQTASRIQVSQFTGEPITIKHKVSSSESKLPHLEYSGNVYETDGCFCSFNCCLAFIRDHKHQPVYIHSETLLMKMYIEAFKVDGFRQISPAPSWRLLKEYGGFMTIDEFRESFLTHKYSQCQTIPLGWLFDEQVVI